MKAVESPRGENEDLIRKGERKAWERKAWERKAWERKAWESKLGEHVQRRRHLGRDFWRDGGGGRGTEGAGNGGEGGKRGVRRTRSCGKAHSFTLVTIHEPRIGSCAPVSLCGGGHRVCASPGHRRLFADGTVCAQVPCQAMSSRRGDFCGYAFDEARTAQREGLSWRSSPPRWSCRPRRAAPPSPSACARKGRVDAGCSSTARARLALATARGGAVHGMSSSRCEVPHTLAYCGGPCISRVHCHHSKTECTNS